MNYTVFQWNSCLHHCRNLEKAEQLTKQNEIEADHFHYFSQDICPCVDPINCYARKCRTGQASQISYSNGSLPAGSICLPEWEREHKTAISEWINETDNHTLDTAIVRNIYKPIKTTNTL